MTRSEEAAALAERIDGECHDTSAPACKNCVLEWLEQALAAAKQAGAESMRERAAGRAMGMTGPGNTVAQSRGYSDACREISAAIRALPLVEPSPAPAEGD